MDFGLFHSWVIYISMCFLVSFFNVQCISVSWNHFKIDQVHLMKIFASTFSLQVTDHSMGHTHCCGMYTLVSLLFVESCFLSSFGRLHQSQLQLYLLHGWLCYGSSFHTLSYTHSQNTRSFVSCFLYCLWFVYWLDMSCLDWFTTRGGVQRVFASHPNWCYSFSSFSTTLICSTWVSFTNEVQWQSINIWHLPLLTRRVKKSVKAKQLNNILSTTSWDVILHPYIATCTYPMHASMHGTWIVLQIVDLIQRLFAKAMHSQMIH